MTREFIISQENNLKIGLQSITQYHLCLSYQSLQKSYVERELRASLYMRNTEASVVEARLFKMEPESGWGIAFSKLSCSYNPNDIWEQQHP